MAMKKLTAVILAVIMLIPLFSGLSVIASAESDAVFEIEVKNNTDDYELQIIVYGKSMKNVTNLSVRMYYDTDCFELKKIERSFSYELGSVLSMIDDLRSAQDGDIQYVFSSQSDGVQTDERVKLFCCTFNPLSAAENKISLEVSADSNEAKMFEYTVDTTECPVTYITDEYRYVVWNNKAIIIDAFDVVGDSGIVTVPEKLGGVPVAEIEKRAFAKTAYMIGVVIPENIDLVSYSVFDDCYSLEWIEVSGRFTTFSGSFDGLRSHVAVFGYEDAFAKRSADACNLRYFSESIISGDVTADGKINAADARLALRIASDLELTNSRADAYADIDKNDKVNAADARTILRIASGLES